MALPDFLTNSTALLVRRRLSGQARVFLIAGFVVTMLLRLCYCTQAPDDSSDLYRHLGFTSHFWENPRAFYWLMPWQFPGEFWSSFWTEVGYIYPPMALLFFAIFGGLGAGLFWVKLVLTLFDLGSALLIARATSGWAGLLVFSAPVTVWYTSHEGQYESMVTFLVVVAVLGARSGAWFRAGAFFMLALQSKQLALLIAPYLLYEIFVRRHLHPRRTMVRFLAGFLAAFLPFLPFYLWRHDLWLLPLQNQQNLLNPFYWPLFWKQAALDLLQRWRLIDVFGPDFRFHAHHGLKDDRWQVGLHGNHPPCHRPSGARPGGRATRLGAGLRNEHGHALVDDINHLDLLSLAHLFELDGRVLEV